MTDTIQTFVEKLQEEGVKTGQQAAELIKSEARIQAKHIVDSANAQSREIIEKAKSQAESIYQKNQTELKLAARDTILKLQDAIIRGISKVLTDPVEDKLSDNEFLGKMLHDVIVQYAASDSQGKTQIDIKVNDKQNKELAGLVIKKLRETKQADKVSVDFHGILQKAGFEYKVGGATVEVTADSIVQLLAELVSPRLRQLLSQTLQEG